MILHWEQLVLHYGNELQPYRQYFESAWQTTYGILCCRSSGDLVRVGHSSNVRGVSVHAERQLLETQLWRIHVPAALARWTEYDTPVTVTLAINRSPCRDCTSRLVRAADALQDRFPLVFGRNRFILACLGAYEDRAMVARTTQNDLRELHAAGWHLCVLQEDAGLTTRGRVLLEGIERIAGRGHVRLG